MDKPVKPPAGPNVPTPVPSRSDRPNFAVRGDATMGALPGVVDGMNANATYASQAVDYVDQQLGLADDAVVAAGQRRDQASTFKDQAQAAAATAVNAPGTSGTSGTSLAVTAGTKTLTTQPGKAWAVGQPVVISRTATPTTVQLWGTVSAYDAGTGAMTVDVAAGGAVGSGTYTDWTIALVGRAGKSDLVTSDVNSAAISVQPWQRVFSSNAAQITFTLPTAPALWDIVSVSPGNGRSDNLVAFGANKHMNISDATMTINVVDATVDFQWTGAAYGWKLV